MIKHSTSSQIEEQAKEIFADLHNARSLIDNHQSGAISSGRIFAHISGQSDETVMQSLKQDLAVRRVYKKMLATRSSFYIREAIAASSDQYPERYCDGCKVRLQASRAESEQLYLIIEIADQRRDMPEFMELFGQEDSYELLELPPARNGVIQTIITRASPIAQLLADPKTELFLR